MDFSSPKAVEAVSDTVATESMAASAIIIVDYPATASTGTTAELAPTILQTVEAVDEPVPDAVVTVAPLPEIATEPAPTESTSAAVTHSAIPAVEPTVAPDPALDTTLAPADVPDQVLEMTPPVLAVIEAPVITEFTTESSLSTSPVEVINDPAPDFAATAAPSPEIVIEPALPESTSVAVIKTMPAVRPVPPVTEPPTITEVPAVPEPSISAIERVVDETNTASTL
jgi:hypothetical protein